MWAKWARMVPVGATSLVALGIAVCVSALLGLAGVAGASLAPSGTTAPICSIYWTGATSTDWGTASNWSLSDNGSAAANAPRSTDVVCMSSAPQNTNVDVSSSMTASVDAIEWPQSGNVAPTLTVAGTLNTGSDPSILNELDVSGGTFGAGSGGVSAGTFSGAGGELDGPGALTVTGSATISSFFLVQSGAHLRLDGTSDVASYLALNPFGEVENAGSMFIEDGGASTGIRSRQSSTTPPARSPSTVRTPPRTTRSRPRSRTTERWT